MGELDLETLAVRAGIERSQHGENSEALFLTSSFVFNDAAQAAARFASHEPGNIYARFTNPTVSMFQERLAAMEGAERCVATASGMAAIQCCFMGLLSAGDHLITSRSLFGVTVQLCCNILSRFGIETSFVSGTDPEEWRAALRPNTRLFFVETPSNPLMEICDIETLAGIAHEAGVWLAVDNCFCSPALQRPLALGADIVIHSATKYLDGQGRMLGGAVLGSDEIMEKVFLFARTTGPTMSAFNAWVFLKGLETLKIRMDAHSASALTLARWLETQPQVTRVYYPGLPSHPQHQLAMRQQSTGGGVVSFDVKGGRKAAWRVIDDTRMISVTANLGDVKSTITHPASTTHGRISPEQRTAAGIGEGLLRVAVGLEAIGDVQADLAQGLKAN
ncbi:MAG: O-succinylhomoserine sulfhydrylase [Rhodocyclaceae bacterium]|nr:O-succinylhomoserine sulfhydrylase [Rhodocyclaceae bacterium]